MSQVVLSPKLQSVPAGTDWCDNLLNTTFSPGLAAAPTETPERTTTPERAPTRPETPERDTPAQPTPFTPPSEPQRREEPRPDPNQPFPMCEK